MDLSSPIRSVIPSVHGAVLAVLARSDVPLSGRRTAELTGGRASQARVNQVLRELTVAGLVLRDEHPPAYLYRLNREHLAAGAVVALADLREQLLSQIRDTVKGWEEPAVAVWLFGSAARGDGGPASDIDVLVLRPDTVDEDEPSWLRQVDDLAAQVATWTGNHCEVLEYSTEQFAGLVAAGEPLTSDLRTEALRISGDTVERRLRRHVS